MIKQYLEVGEITGTHGVHGEMRLNPWCDSPDFVKRFKTLYFDSCGNEPIGLVSARPHGNVAILKLSGIDTVEKAQALRGKILYMKRSDAKLPDGKYFIAELLDCVVKDADDPEIVYGRLSGVSQTGANDVWHVTNDKGEYLIPAIPSVVTDTDVEKGEVTIRPLKGIFDDED